MATIFFYDRDHGSGALGDLAPNKLTTIKSFAQGSFGSWTHVTARGATYLFYQRYNGAGAIGVVSGSSFATTKSFGAGSFGAWTHIVNTWPGLLFYNQMTGAAAIGALDANGFTTTGSMTDGALAEWTHIIANGATVLFYNRLNGSGAVAAITQTELTTTTSYQAGSFGVWTHVVNNGPTVLFYNRDTGAGAIGTLSPTGFATTIAYNPGSFGTWTHVSASGATVFFYNRDAGAAAIGSLTPAQFSTTTTYQGGQLSRWTHVTGDASSGPEETELKIGVLLCHWQRPPALTTVLSPDFYRHYLFDLSAPHGVGRYWFDQSGGHMRFTGYVRDWLPLSKAPSDPSITFNRKALAIQAIADAQRAGWQPGDERLIVILVACLGANGVDAGAVGDLIPVNGINRKVAVLHADAANWIAASGGNVFGSNFRFDFNAHEIGHLVGNIFSFSHAFGPNGPYDHPYCIMAAKTYGSLGSSVLYDLWTPTSSRTPEEHTKGPGLAGATRAACGWARMRRFSASEVQQGVNVYLAHLGDHESTLPQVLEFPVMAANGTPATFAIEFRSPLEERDQALAPTIVVTQREGSAWSNNPTWGQRSSTFRSVAVVGAGALPTVTEAGVIQAAVVQVGPSETRNGLSGPSWVQLRLSK